MTTSTRRQFLQDAALSTGADLERQPKGFQVMGIKYTQTAADPRGPAAVDSQRLNR